MMTTRSVSNLLLLSVGSATLAVTLAAWGAGHATGVAAAALGGALWAAWARWTLPRRPEAASALALLMLALTAISAREDVLVGWGFAGAVSILCSWDLSRFLVRLRTAKQLSLEGALVTQHLRLLGLTVLLSGGLGVASATWGTIPFDFDRSLILSLLLLGALSVLVRRLRLGSD